MDLDDEVYIYTDSYQLYEVYKISHKGAPIIRRVGSWSRESDSFDFVNEGKYSRRGDLGVSIKVLKMDPKQHKMRF